MSNDMVAISASQLPAHLRKKGKVENKFANAMGAGGFPIVSIKGKVFHLIRGDERTLVKKPGDDDEPASSLEVVILASNPNKSKVYYAHGYEEGSSDKPDCYSNDGVGPALDAEEPQAKKCATCPHNQWGSRITENGGKGKACSDSMRLAIAPAGQLNDPMLIRVPAASLKTLGSYGAQLAKRGMAPEHVVTKIGFDYNVAHPALTFKAVRFIEEDELAAMEQSLDEESETIDMITGVNGAAGLETAKTEAEVEVEPKVKKSKKLDAAVEEVEAAPKTAKVKVEAEESEEEEEQAAAPKKSAPVKSVADYDDIDDALDNLEFDD